MTDVTRALVWKYLEEEGITKVLENSKDKNVKKVKESLAQDVSSLDGPGITEVVEHFMKTGKKDRRKSLQSIVSSPKPASPAKIAKNKKVKQNGTTNGHVASPLKTPAKQTKKPSKEESSDESSTEEDEVPAKKSKAKATPKKEESSDESSSDEETPAKTAVAPKVAPQKTESSDEDSSDDEQVTVKQPVKPTPKVTAKKESSSDESSSEEEDKPAPAKKSTVKPSPKVVKKKESSSEESSSEDETTPVQKTPVAVTKKAPAKVAKKEESSSEDSSSEEEAPAKKVPAKPAAKTPAKESSSEDSSSEDEAPAKPTKPAPKVSKKEESSSEDSSDEEEAPAKKAPKVSSKAVKKDESSSDESSSEEETAPVKPQAKAVKKKSSSEDSSSGEESDSSEEEAAPVKKQPEVTTPAVKRGRDEGADVTPAHKKQKFSGEADEGSELFVRQTRDLTNEDLEEYFTKFGTVNRAQVAVDRETGNSRGFAFISMGSSHDAKTVLAEGFAHNINGTTVQLRISESKENVNKRKSNDFGGNQNKFNRNESSEESVELFVKNVQSLSEDQLVEHFGQYGNVSRAKIVYDRESGEPKDFGFVTFDSADAVKTATDAGVECDIGGTCVYYRATRSDNQEADNNVRTLAGKSTWSGGKREPFRRVRAEDISVDPRFSNSFEDKKGGSNDWGAKAYNSLKVTRGKRFTHEKNKKKRGSYSGGTIDFAVNSIKFDD